MHGVSSKKRLPAIALTTKLINRTKVTFLAVAAALACLAFSADATISFGPTGTGILPFTNAPAATEWATAVLAGSAPTIATVGDMDTAIQALAAPGITTTLPTSATDPPSTSALGFRYNTTRQALQSRPTTVGGVVLLATLQNDSGSAQNSLTITYDMAIQSAGGSAQLPGWHVYYSLTGAASSWTKIADLSDFETNVLVSATVYLVSPWVPGSTLYLLWADDNGDPGSDQSYTLDNFSVVVGPPPTPPTITNNPSAEVVVVQGRSTNLTVEATGSRPLFYQWYKVGPGAIAGATAATLSITNAQPGVDDGQYYCVVSNFVSTATSVTVNLTVSSDSTPPSVVSATGSEFLDKVTVRFDEPVDRPLAEDEFNYGLSGGATELFFIDAVLSADGLTVVLTLTAGTRMEENTLYTLTVSGVTDLVGNPLGNNTATFRSFVLVRSFLNFAAYNNISGDAVANLTVSPTFPDFPSERLFMTAFDTRTVYPNDSHENYGARITGVFIPPESGNWIFYLRSDNGSELYLNPVGTDPAGKSLLKQEAGRSIPFSVNVSAPQALAEGQPYYIEALCKEGTGADYCQVAAKLETDPTPPDSLPPIPGSQLGCYADTNAVVLSITQQPTNQAAIDPETARVVAGEDFNSNDGGFTVVSVNGPAKPWIHTNGTWQASDGSGAAGCGTLFRHSRLNSPYYSVPAAGPLTLSFAHRYSWEADTTLWDAGQLRISVNGGPYVAVRGSSFTFEGYNGVPGGASIPNCDLAGQEAFTSTSAGHGGGSYITSTAVLGSFAPSDAVSVQFFAAWDDCAEAAQPNWEIDSIQLSPSVEDRNAEAPVTFAVQATAVRPGVTNLPVFYQWQRDNGSGFADILSANSASYNLYPALRDNGARFRCVVQTPGVSVTSDAVTLTVTTPTSSPTLTVSVSGGNVVITWPAPSTGFVLEQTTTLFSPPGSTVWTPEGSTPEVVGGFNKVTITPAAGQKFYRLHKP